MLKDISLEKFFTMCPFVNKFYLFSMSFHLEWICLLLKFLIFFPPFFNLKSYYKTMVKKIIYTKN